MRRWETLGIDGYGIYQDAALGRFTEDPVRLVHFMRAGVKDTCLDLGTGNGIIALYANALYGCPFTGLDTDAEQLALARASAERNGQDLTFLEADVSSAPELLKKASFSVVACNPPYFSSGPVPDSPHRARERYTASPEPFIAAAAALLKNGGRFYLCYPSEKLPELCVLLDRYSLEPKRIELLTHAGKTKRFLLEAKKNARPGVTITVGE